MEDHLVQAYNQLLELVELRWPGMSQAIAFELSDEPYRPPRGFAHCIGSRRGALIQMAPELAHEPRGRIYGVIAHELGHAVTYLTGVCPLDQRTAELLADELGAFIVGQPIGYDYELVQDLGGGTARPLLLDY